MKLSTLVTSAAFILSFARALCLPRNAVITTAAAVPELDQINSSCCVCNQDSVRRYKRSPHGEVSLSPGDAFRSLSQANSTSGETSSQAWPPTVETILTVTFRAVVTVLSLLNVGFTWRIHGISIIPNTQGYTWTNRCVIDIHGGHRWRPWRRQRPLIGREWPL